MALSIARSVPSEAKTSLQKATPSSSRPALQAANRSAARMATRRPDIPAVALPKLDAAPANAVTGRRNTLAKSSTQKTGLTVDSISETGSTTSKERSAVSTAPLIVPLAARPRNAPASNLNLTPTQVLQELQKLDRRISTTAETIASRQHDRDALKMELIATKRALAQTEAKVTATEKMLKGLNGDLWSLRKQLDKSRNTCDEVTTAFKKYVNLSEQSTGKLNKLWNKVEEIERRGKERNRVARPIYQLKL